MKNVQYEKILRNLGMIREYCDSIEQASQSLANSEQSVVGPSNAVDSENPALARPATQSEWLSIIERELVHIMAFYVHREHHSAFGGYAKRLIQSLKDLDQGPIAKRFSKEEFIEAMTTNDLVDRD